MFVSFASPTIIHINPFFLTDSTLLLLHMGCSIIAHLAFLYIQRDWILSVSCPTGLQRSCLPSRCATGCSLPTQMGSLAAASNLSRWTPLKWSCVFAPLLSHINRSMKQNMHLTWRWRIMNREPNIFIFSSSVLR